MSSIVLLSSSVNTCPFPSQRVIMDLKGGDKNESA
nr:MAG TPA: hypothetical protein [Caudoviricetes sp.]